MKIFTKQEGYVNKKKNKKSTRVLLLIILTLSILIVLIHSVDTMIQAYYANKQPVIIYVNRDAGVVEDTAKEVTTEQVEETTEIDTPLTISVEMSAYTSRVEETDSSPCISADGTNICEYDGCVVASNDYALGTEIEVEGFGICEVRDRMNKRYTATGNMDIYFGMDLDGALQFGRRNVNIRVI